MATQGTPSPTGAQPWADESRDEHGRWASGGGSVAGAPPDEHTGAGIRKAMEERPARLTHGHTASNAFWIGPGGEVVARDELPWPPKSLAGYTDVHSHLPDYNGSASEVQMNTFSGGDVETFAKEGRLGLRKMVVVTSPTRMDVLESVPGETDPKFLTLGKASISKQLAQGGNLEARQAQYAERSAWYEGLSSERKAELKSQHAEVSYEYERQKLRDFAKRYRLRYREGVPWK